MFGLFKTKEINSEQLKTNITEVVLNAWVNNQNLRHDKFDSFVRLSKASGNTVKPEKFMTEKLRYITSVAVISLRKAGVDELIIDEIINNIKTEVNSAETRGASAALGLKSKEYAEIRFSTNPREAGKLTENKFSQESFGYTPSNSDTDRRYTLYKALSSFERSVIFEISSAIRKSRI